MKRHLLTAGALLATAAPANAHHGNDHCNTRACDARVTHKHAKNIKRAVTRPYRAWLRTVAFCESTNNPQAVSRDGRYFGLYQFDLRTWASVGGRGNPTGAGRLEQDYRAVLLRQRRGSNPWPVCG